MNHAVTTLRRQKPLEEEAPSFFLCMSAILNAICPRLRSIFAQRARMDDRAVDEWRFSSSFFCDERQGFLHFQHSPAAFQGIRPPALSRCGFLDASAFTSDVSSSDFSLDQRRFIEGVIGERGDYRRNNIERDQEKVRIGSRCR
ncbi:MAG: hypothetical protein MZW92_71970 [Comamonadaceae bacterium]|nr:hypothetical protein [Comamonadaceae bacterium]